MAPLTKKSKKNGEVKAPAVPSVVRQTSQPPAWPPLQLERSYEQLELHHLLLNQIVTISRFFPTDLCKRYVSYLSNLPLVTTPGIPKKGNAVRVNDRFQIDDPAFAEALWSSTGLKELILDAEQLPDASSDGIKQFWGGEVVGLNPNIRIYRYRKGQFFDQHYDDSNNIIHPNAPSSQAQTTWTLLLYLTSASNGCIGGETVFYPSSLPATGKKNNKSQSNQGPIAVALETGMALLHKHGRDCMLHEGKEVLEGEKWVIRSDLCVKR